MKKTRSIILLLLLGISLVSMNLKASPLLVKAKMELTYDENGNHTGYTCITCDDEGLCSVKKCNPPQPY